MDDEEQSPQEQGSQVVDTADDSDQSGMGKESNFIAGARDSQPKDALDNLAGKAKKAFFSKNRNKIIFGTIGGGVSIAGIAAIFFLLLLFKNIHIKHLFMDYEFAKFNRAYAARLNEAIKEASAENIAKGDVATTADPAESPEKQLEKAIPEEVDKVATDEQARQQSIREVTTLDQVDIPGTTGGEIATDLGENRSVPPEEGSTDEERQAKDTAAVTDEISGKETGKSAPLSEINEATDVVKEGKKAKTPRIQLSEAGAEKLSSALDTNAKLQGVFFYATLACIVRDIYLEGYHAFTQLKVSGLSQIATTTSKYADGQKLGKITATQAGAVANLYDNGKESFTQSAGYARATGQPVAREADGTVKNDLPQELRPTGSPDGAVGTLLDIGKALEGFKLGPINTLESTCDFILSPLGQASAGALNLGLVAAAVITTPATFGLGDAAVIGATTAGTIIGTKVGTALLTDVVLHYGGGLFANLSPIDMGNAMGAGAKVNATDSCRDNGCRKLSADENQTLALAITRDERESLKKQSIAYRLFSPSNPYSPVAMAADKIPTSGTAMLASMGHMMANMFNPAKLIALGGNFATIMTPSAQAATVEANTYGIPDYGFTDQELNQYSVIENSRWVESHMEDFKKFESRCLKSSFVDYINPQDDHSDCSTGDNLRYRLYALDRRVTFDFVLRYNNQSTDSSPTGGATTPSPLPAGASVYFIGDSITEGMSTVLTTDLAKTNNTAAIDASVSRSIEGPGTTGNKLSGLAGIDADSTMVASAKTLVVGLGTNPGGSIDLQTFAGQVDATIDVLRHYNPTAPIYWINLVSTSSPQYPERNSVLATEATKKNFTVIDARSRQIPLSPDNIHPTGPGYQAMAQYVVTMIIGTTTKSGPQ